MVMKILFFICTSKISKINCLLNVMADEKPCEFENKNKMNENSIDIIDKLTKFIDYLNIHEDCDMLLKLSKTDLQNEIKFNQRAEQIIKHHQSYDQIKVEENIINELQKSINAITNDLDNKSNKKKLESKKITEIYDCLMTLKMINIKKSKNIKSLQDFLMLNKISMDDVTKIENELKIVLDKISKEKLPKKSEFKVAEEIRDRRPSILSISNGSRRNNHDANFQVHPIPRIQVDRIRHSGNVTNDNLNFNSQTNEALRMRFENDQIEIVESFSNRPNTDQNTRYRCNEESMSNNLMTSSMEDDLQLLESPNFDSSVNLCKDNEDNTSGDIYLLLQPQNNWMDSE